MLPGEGAGARARREGRSRVKVKACRPSRGRAPGLEFVLEHEGRETSVHVPEREIGISMMGQQGALCIVVGAALDGAMELLCPSPEAA
jgi:hypothetical protein